MTRLDNIGVQDNIFMKTFKYYKSNNPKPSLDEVLFLGTSTDGIQRVNFENNIDKSQFEIMGLQNYSDWSIVSFDNHPGLILISNPFTSLGQRYWIRKCLEEYTKKPNKTNIDIEVYLDDWWAECYKNGQCDEKLLKKMRWATLGYHHNWDTKMYSEENKNDMPGDLIELCHIVSRALGFMNFRAEAAIVNYYHMGSTLSAHTDHSEVNLDAPLFSFSFGQSAIFLLGGQDKTVKPTAIMLNSGDIVVMSKTARLCYHAVPKILQGPSDSWNDKNHLDVLKNNATLRYIDSNKLIFDMNRNLNNDAWSKFNKYVTNSRININVRQVLNEKQKSLDENVI